MEYKFIIQGRVDCSESELIGAKDAVTDALELMGFETDYINVMPAEMGVE